MDVNRRTRMSTCRQVNIKRYYRHDDKLHPKYLIMTNQLYAYSGLFSRYLSAFSNKKLVANIILGNTMFQTYLKDFLVALLTLGAL